MAVANPITSKIQTIAMHRDGAYWKLAQLPDLITCDDPFFRPVALTNGPDGCIYIVDWYNKIISHNEVPRAHPDRDKTRGRIWRVKPKAAKTEVADFTKMSTDELVALLGKEPVAQAHLAWQTLADLRLADDTGIVKLAASESERGSATQIQCLWVLENTARPLPDCHTLIPLLSVPDAQLRFEALTVLNRAASVVVSQRGDFDFEIRPLAPSSGHSPHSRKLLTHLESMVNALLAFAKPSLPNGPTIQSSRGPAKQLPVREAYDREFERFLVRMFLERHPDVVAKFLDSEAAAKLPVEARVLASLALEPKASASRVAKLLPQLDRAPNDEELLRLAQFPAEAGVGEALQALLTHEKSRAAVAEKLLAQRTKLDAKQIAPLLTETAKQMLRSADTPSASSLALIGGFQLTSAGSDSSLLQPRSGTSVPKTERAKVPLLDPHTLRDLRSAKPISSPPSPRPIPILSRAMPRSKPSPPHARRMPPRSSSRFILHFSPAQRRSALNALSSSKAGAKTIVTALLDKTLPQADLDGPTVERLATVLGDDPAITQLQQQLGGIFREVLLLDGQDTAWVDSKITLDGPFTVETWVRLAPGIGNEDSLLGAPAEWIHELLRLQFRVYAGPELHDVCVATKPMTPDLWTHIAVTRDAQGIIRIYQNGELDATGSKPAPQKWENCQHRLERPR
jgi:hypothetical protein